MTYTFSNLCRVLLFIGKSCSLIFLWESSCWLPIPAAASPFVTGEQVTLLGSIWLDTLAACSGKIPSFSPAETFLHSPGKYTSYAQLRDKPNKMELNQQLSTDSCQLPNLLHSDVADQSYVLLFLIQHSPCHCNFHEPHFSFSSSIG